MDAAAGSLPRVHVIGRRGHGKTELAVAIVGELARRGFRVATVKHTPHAHELDQPGKESHRHRLAGARVAAVVAENMSAVYVPHEFVPEALAADPYAALRPLWTDCDVVVVEGGHDVPGGVKVEAWLGDGAGRPLSAELAEVAFVVTAGVPPAAVVARSLPWLPSSDVVAVVDRIVAAWSR